jgi:uncharacterized protein (TIGR02147 family)
MEFNWLADSYREIINQCLGYKLKRRPRGAIMKLASALQCHPTFIAQVLNEKSNLSLEQGQALSEYFQFSKQEQEYFFLLLQKERAGTQALKRYFQDQLQRILEEKRDLRPKLTTERPSLGAFEVEYFSNWIYQTVHGLTQIPKFQTVQTLSKFLNLNSEELKFILSRLALMNLVTNEKNLWKCTKNSLHLPKDSPFIRNLHSTWKTKIITDLQSQLKKEGTQFSGIIAVSEKDYQKIRDLLVKTLESIRNITETSVAENLYLLSLDCYKFE